jgi:GDSL-like Lipase/Acylhydrolase
VHLQQPDQLYRTLYRAGDFMMRTLKIILLAFLSSAAFGQDTPPPVSLGGSVGITGGQSLTGSNILTHMTDANYTMVAGGWWAGTQIIPSSLTQTAVRTITAPSNPGQPYVFFNHSTGGFADTLMPGGIPIANCATTPAQCGTVVRYDSVSGNYVQGGASGGVSQIIAGTNVTITPSGGTGAVTVNAAGGGNPYTSLQTFGDSITQGTGASTFMQPCIKGQPCTWPGDIDLPLETYSNGPTAYAYLLQADYGNSAFNYGRGGDLSTDMTWHNAIWAHPTLQNNPMRTAMIGTNDNSLCGTSTNCQDTTSKAELFSAANSVIPDALKTFASSCTKTGTWTADANLPGAMYATTSGATMSCTFPSSTTKVYVAYEKCDNTGNTAAGTLTVNGSAGSIEPTVSFFGLGGSTINYGNQTSFASGSGMFSGCTLALARNGGVVGSNTVLFTSTNSTKTEIFWMAGGYTPTGNAPPIYIQGGVPYEAANAGQPGVGQYNTIAHAVQTTLAGDGLNVLWADVQAAMNYTTDFSGGTQATGDAICGVNSPNGLPWAATWASPLHPGDGGMCHIYEAFHNAIAAPPSVQSKALEIWAGPFGTITGANSLGGRYGADGGLNGVGASSVLDYTNTGNAASVGNDYAVPGEDYLQLRYYGSGNGALSGVYGIYDPTTTVYSSMRGADGTPCFNIALANISDCAGGYPIFGVGVGNAALNRLVVPSSASSAAAGYQFRVPGVDAFDLQFFSTGNGAGLAGAGGLFDETTSHFVWSTCSSDDIFGYTPISNVCAGSGSTWSILHTGAATFTQVTSNGPITVNGPSSGGIGTTAIIASSSDSGGTGIAIGGTATGVHRMSVDSLSSTILATGVPSLLFGDGTTNFYGLSVSATNTSTAADLMPTAAVLGWVNGPSLELNTPDTGFSKCGAACVAVGNGTAGNAGGSMAMTNLTLTGTCTGCGSGMVYPGAGIPNSTGSAWGTSYGVSGTGSVALTASPTFTGTPVLPHAAGSGSAVTLSATGGSISCSTVSCLDLRGGIFMGVGITSATVTFATAYGAAPVCNVVQNSVSGTPTFFAPSWVTSTTALTITPLVTLTGTVSFDYMCVQ